jgi:hypothetical protein
MRTDINVHSIVFDNDKWNGLCYGFCMFIRGGTIRRWNMLLLISVVEYVTASGTFGTCTVPATTYVGNYSITIRGDALTLCPQQIISIADVTFNICV